MNQISFLGARLPVFVCLALTSIMPIAGCRAKPAESGRSKQATPAPAQTVEAAYRTFFAALASKKKEKEVKALDAVLPHRSDLEQLFPRIARKYFESYENRREILLHEVELAADPTDESLGKIIVHDIRQDDPDERYARVLTMIPDAIPVYELEIVQGTSHLHENWVFLRGRWLRIPFELSTFPTDYENDLDE